MGYEYSKGCDLCRQRKVKCDETKPGCLRCRQYNVQCPGYSARPLRFLIASSGQQLPSSTSRRSPPSLSDEQSMMTMQSLTTPSPNSRQDVEANATIQREEENLLRLLTDRMDFVSAGHPIMFEFLQRLASKGPLSQQCVLLLPAAMLATFIEKSPDPALTHVNRCLNSIRSRLELRTDEFDPDLLISIASMAHLDNLVLLYRQGFYNPLDNVARHWQASVALLQQHGITAIQPEDIDQVIFWNWTDCTMIVPQLLADYQRFDPEAPQIDAERSQSSRLWEDVALLHRLLEPEQSIFEAGRDWSSLEPLQSAPLRQGLRRLHDLLTKHLSGKMQDITHVMVYGSLGILTYIHCMLLLNSTYVLHHDFWSQLTSILVDTQERENPYMCCLHVRIFLITSDEIMLKSSTKGKEKQETDNQRPLWTVSRVVRVVKLLSEPFLRRVLDTLLFNVLGMSTEVGSDRAGPVLSEDELYSDITRKTELIAFSQSVSEDRCPFGEVHDWT